MDIFLERQFIHSISKRSAENYWKQEKRRKSHHQNRNVYYPLSVSVNFLWFFDFSFAVVSSKLNCTPVSCCENLSAAAARHQLKRTRTAWPGPLRN